MMADGSRAVFALDLGTKTGWALRQKDKRIFSGVENFAPKRFEGGGMRYLRFERWLDEVLTPLLPDVEIYYEEVRYHAGVDAAHVYGGLMAHMQKWCDQRGVPYAGVPVATIKKFISGKGGASKELVIKSVETYKGDVYGLRPADDNEADALAILLCATEGNVA